MIKVQAMFQEKSDALRVIEQAQKKEQEYLRTFQDGYAEGYSDGWDKALENVQGIIRKYNLGGGQELKPAVKFMQNSIGAQIQKIYEEFIEVSDAYNNGESTERVAEEACDVQQTCETLLAMLGYDDEERRKLRQKVLCKNASRGYYND